jgi:hypothetical protein
MRITEGNVYDLYVVSTRWAFKAGHQRHQARETKLCVLYASFLAVIHRHTVRKPLLRTSLVKRPVEEHENKSYRAL